MVSGWVVSRGLWVVGWFWAVGSGWWVGVGGTFCHRAWHGHELEPLQWPSEQGVASFESWWSEPSNHRYNPQQKATSPRSHEATSPHITDVRQPQEELQSSNETIDTSFKIAMHAHSSSMRFVRSPCKRSSQQTISRCGISAAKTFTTGGFQASRPPPFLLFLPWWYFQCIQTLEQYHFLSAGLLNGWLLCEGYLFSGRKALVTRVACRLITTFVVQT